MTPQLAISILFGLLAAVIWILLALLSEASRPAKRGRVPRKFTMTAFGWREK
jgi:hypothetical protein